MTAPIQPTPIDLLPVGPRPTDTAEQFDAKSFATIEAQEAMVPQINAATAAAYQNAVAADERAVTAGDAAAAATGSAGMATTEANRSRDEADRSEAAKRAALVAAAAAGAAAGFPSMAGKAGRALVVNAAENGAEWKSAGLEVGGIYTGSKKPALGTWLDTDAVYLQASYPALFTALGLVPGVAPWTQRTIATVATPRGIAYGNGIWVIVGTDGGGAAVGASSPDGITWTARVVAAVEAVTFGNGLFVSVGTNAVRTSPDGITWTTRTIPAGSWNSVAYGGGMFVAVGTSGVIASSPDGTNWTARSGLGSVTHKAIAYGAGRFVTLAPQTSGGGGTSTDGITWTPISTPVGIVAQGLTFGNGLFVGVGTYGAITSQDGLTWTPRTMPGANGVSGYVGVSYYNGRFIAVGSQNAGNPVFAESPDGATWTSRFMPAGGYPLVLAANGLIVATGSLTQTAPMFQYNTATQFYVPAPAGVVGLKSWMKAGD